MPLFGMHARALVSVVIALASACDPAAASEPKSTTDGIYLTAPFSAEVGANSVTISVDRIDNSSTRATAALRLEVWVAAARPDRGAGFNGWRLGTVTLDPLRSGQSYTSIVRDASLTNHPPAGTYWMVLTLDEANAAAVCSENGGYCIEDSLIFQVPVTFGPNGMEKAVPIVEYYNADLDHYFITAEGFESVIVDSGVDGRWERTGESFWGWLDLASAPIGAIPLYRFYAGATTNSHFYTAIEAEKDLLVSLNPTNSPEKGWALEGVALYVVGSDQKRTTVCLPGSRVVQRLYNNGSNRGIGSNHRYIMDPGLIEPMRNRGWQPEGTQVCYKDRGELRFLPQPINCAVGLPCQGVVARAQGGGDGVFRAGVAPVYRFRCEGDLLFYCGDPLGKSRVIRSKRDGSSLACPRNEKLPN